MATIDDRARFEAARQRSNLGAMGAEDSMNRKVFHDLKTPVAQTESGRATRSALEEAADRYRQTEQFARGYGGQAAESASRLMAPASIWGDFLGVDRMNKEAYTQKAAPSEWAQKRGDAFMADARALTTDPLVNQQRDAAMAARAQQAGALELMRERAQGRNLIADQMARAQTQRMNNQMLSAARSGRSGYDPAAFRAAAQAAQGAGADIGQQAAIAGQQEQLAAEQALAQGAGAMRGADLQAFGQEGALGAQALGLGLKGQTDYDTLGLQANLADRASLQAMDAQEFMRRQAAAQAALSGYSTWAGKQSSPLQLVSAGVGAGAGMLGGLGSILGAK